MDNSLRSTNSYHVRSVSAPCRLHPAALRVGEELNKFKTVDTSSCQTSEAICNGLFDLAKLYDCTNDLLSLQLIREATQIDDMLDGSMMLLDICGGTRDVISQLKEQMRELGSAIRRRKGDSTIESSIAKFNSFRRKTKKEAKRLIVSLKQINENEATLLLGQDQQHSSVLELLRQVSFTSISVLKSLLMCVYVPVSKPKGTRWSIITKMIHTQRVSCEERMENSNELESIDALFSSICRISKGEKIEYAQRKLVAMESYIEGIESNLECLFRRLIKTRASFINMASP